MSPAHTPVHQLPYITPGDAIRLVPDTSRALAERLDIVLQQQGATPLDGDLASVLARLTALEQRVAITARYGRDAAWHNADVWVVPQWAPIAQHGAGLAINAPTDSRQIIASRPMLVLLTAAYTVDQARRLDLKALVNGDDAGVYGQGFTSGSGQHTTATLAGLVALAAGDVLTITARSASSASVSVPETTTLQIAELRSLA